MLLTPRYGTDPLLELDGDPAAIAAPAVRQRRRLVTALHRLTAEQWNHPSRCAQWSVRDVIVHLDGTNGFWDLTTQAGLAGERTEFLATFDPVASPAAMVAASDASAADVLASFSESTERLVGTWEGIDEAGWTRLAEAPPGHISIGGVAHHALWDSWIHERDVFLPLGIDVDDEPDEVSMILRYAACLAPALAIARDDGRVGRFSLAATEPGVAATVDIGDSVRVTKGAADGAFTLSGGAVEMVEAFSFRTPFGHRIPDEHRWMFAGLAEVFETDGP